MKKNILRNKIDGLKKESHYSFHMPGHKRKKDTGNFFDYDITEIPGADNLHDSRDVIREVQEKLAKVYGSEETSILINGTTTGIQGAILGTCNPGEKLLVPMNCHRSVFGALALGRVEGVFLPVEIHETYCFGKEISLEKVKDAIEKEPSIKGMILTNPTYYGTTSQVKEICDFLHEKNKFLIVDEAHGAHLHFNKNLPMDGVAAGADVIIQSTHKLLGSLTQSSLMHFQGNRRDVEKIKMFLALIQSSSPSYPLMISVEEAVDEAYEFGDTIFQRIIEAHKAYCKAQNPRDGIILYDPKQESYDRSKWLFITKKITGEEVEKMLRDDYKIQCELSEKDYVLAMTGIGTAFRDIRALTHAIQEINEKTKDLENRKKEKASNYDIILNQKLNLVIPLWEGLYYEKKEWIPLSSGKDRIAGSFIIPYPPGIPMLLTGSQITEEIINKIIELLESGVTVVGVNEKREVLVLGDMEK